MKPRKNIRLTRKTAVELICATIPIPKNSIQGGGKAPGVFIYTAAFGGLSVNCTNDWYRGNGRIELTISDDWGGNIIRMYFHPDTLNRDFGAEEAEKEDDRRVLRQEWAQRVGREKAHKCVDQYCEGC